MVQIHPDKEAGQLLPAGNYEVMVSNTDLIHNEDKDTYRLQVTMKVLEGEYKNTTINDWLPLADNALWRSMPILRGMGLDIPNDISDYDLDESELIGKNFVATFIEDEYNGRKRNVLDAAAPSGKKFSKSAIEGSPF